MVLIIEIFSSKFSNREFVEHYNGTELVHNGPGALTRVLQKICRTNLTYEMTPKACSDFKVHPIETFYPIYHLETIDLFNSTSSGVETTLEKVKKSPAIHLFNSYSFKYKSKYLDETVLKILAKQNCPKVLSAVPIGEDF